MVQQWCRDLPARKSQCYVHLVAKKNWGSENKVDFFPYFSSINKIPPRKFRDFKILNSSFSSELKFFTTSVYSYSYKKRMPVVACR